VTTPAGAEQFAAEEKDREHNGAGSKQRKKRHGGRIGQAEGFGRDAAEELVDFVLHDHHFAMMVPAGKLLAGQGK
jgi:hypothetical protein